MHDVIDIELAVINEHLEFIIKSLCRLLNQSTRVFAQDDSNIKVVIECQRKNTDECSGFPTLHPSEQHSRIVRSSCCLEKFVGGFFRATKCVHPKRRICGLVGSVKWACEIWGARHGRLE